MKVIAIVLISLFVLYIAFSLCDLILKAVKKRKKKNSIVSNSPSDGDIDKSNEEVK